MIELTKKALALLKTLHNTADGVLTTRTVNKTAAQELIHHRLATISRISTGGANLCITKLGSEYIDAKSEADADGQGTAY
jgi:hypothetical protein